MTPETWQRIDDLFDAALQLEPAEREDWLRRTCADDDLRAEIGRLLEHDDRATQTGFLTPPRLAGDSALSTGTFPPREDPDSALASRLIGSIGAAPAEFSCGFTPRAAIAVEDGPHPSDESRSVVQMRLRELAMIYVFLFVMAIVWRHIVVGRIYPVIFVVNTLAVLILAGTALVLSSRRRFSVTHLQLLELGIIGTTAAIISFGQLWLMLEESLREDRMMAQLVMKNIVLITAVLILTYGLYVPKSWRRAALVVVPLALMPFANLLVLYLWNPQAMGWLGRGWQQGNTARVALFSFDAMVLAIVAFAVIFGAQTVSRLRRQVAEARQFGQYRLRKRIGSGGMGEVYLAEHQLLKRPCALKLIRPENVADPHALERFEREVQITATLSHPNTIEIFDYGRTEDGTYYYVMEYLPGMSLAELVARHGALPPGRAVYLLRQACMALSEAHAAGLIHRDVKPSNIFAARRGRMDDVAKLLDFGLVRPAAPSVSAHLSREGEVLGTPLFMSPEQARGRELDERSDIYSLGAVAYYILTGRPPFDDDDGIGVMIAHARDPVVPPSQMRSGIPDDLDRVVLRCLAKVPADRFPDAASLERALSECACSDDWDQGRAVRWWCDQRRAHATTPQTVAAQH
jgi:tRNA A-37 threonylcarbamoyl transferase component Bud32